MISTQLAIAKTRRDLAVGVLLRWAAVVACIAAMVGQRWLSDAGLTATAVFSIAAGGWLILSFQSMRGSRMAADSGMLIAAGRFDLAEEHLEEAIASFSIFRSAKLLCLHHLAVLRHAESRWQDAAALCRALLRQHRSNQDFTRSSRLILAESLLRMGDLGGTQENLMRLYQQRLSLNQALQLLSLQLDYSSRVGDWAGVFAGVVSKVQLAELLPSPAAARAQAQLALAAHKLNQADWRRWLQARAQLLVDPAELCREQPLLAELWQS